MTSRAHIEVDPELLDTIGKAYHREPERSADGERDFLVLDADGLLTTFWAPSVDAAVA